ncbi:MAG: hypothetical protein GX442_13070 [Candidatus Riflebacteria bacterium]|nr:hypothetical protein [Candidatus Riflebacteria bacterium]
MDSVDNVYVADEDNDRIQKFTSTGVFVSTFGSAGSGDWQFASPTGVAVDSTGRVLVADSANHRVRAFSP